MPSAGVGGVLFHEGDEVAVRVQDAELSRAPGLLGKRSVRVHDTLRLQLRKQRHAKGAGLTFFTLLSRADQVDVSESSPGKHDPGPFDSSLRGRAAGS